MIWITTSKEARISVFFSREPEKYAREHFHKSVREYFECAREYKYENVPVNLRSAREPPKKCPLNSSKRIARETRIVFVKMFK